MLHAHSLCLGTAGGKGALHNPACLNKPLHTSSGAASGASPAGRSVATSRDWWKPEEAATTALRRPARRAGRRRGGRGLAAAAAAAAAGCRLQAIRLAHCACAAAAMAAMRFARGPVAAVGDQGAGGQGGRPCSIEQPPWIANLRWQGLQAGQAHCSAQHATALLDGPLVCTWARGSLRSPIAIAWRPTLRACRPTLPCGHPSPRACRQRAAGSRDGQCSGGGGPCAPG